MDFRFVSDLMWWNLSSGGGTAMPVTPAAAACDMPGLAPFEWVPKKLSVSPQCTENYAVNNLMDVDFFIIAY